jgi:multiple antibiotic resistance protein
VQHATSLSEIGKAFLILFAVIDIVGGIPLILQVRQKAGKIYPAALCW